MASSTISCDDPHVAHWKAKQLVRKLSVARGAGTTLISIIIPAGGQLGRVTSMLDAELGTAACIKSRVTRQSVIAAIKSTREKLKRYTHVPPNGLAIFCGIVVASTAVTAGGGGSDGGDAAATKARKVNISFEPIKPVHVAFYHCDNRFHVQPIAALLHDAATFGFVIVDGNGCLIGTLRGSTRKVLHKFSVRLPKKHGRGGFSAARFGRLRMEARQQFVRKVAALAKKLLIDPATNRPSVRGLVLAGAAALKQDLLEDATFDPRLRAAVLCTVDVSYGGENGFSQAIELAAKNLRDVQYLHEKALVSRFFELIAKETGTYSYGLEATLARLEQGTVETLIVADDLAVERIEYLCAATGEHSVELVDPATAAAAAAKRQAARRQRLLAQRHGGGGGGSVGSSSGGGEVSGGDGGGGDGGGGDGGDATRTEIARQPLAEWLSEHYRRFGARLEFVSGRSEEGTQFRRGFGGLGAVLRWRVEHHHHHHDPAHNGPASVANAAAAAAGLGPGGLHGEGEEKKTAVDDFDFDEYEATMDYEDDFM